jgi:hypothetical protein
VAVFDVYCDESGTHKEAEYLTVGGAIAKKSAWRTLESRWNAVLKKNGVKMFHASKFFGSMEDFQGWDDTRKTAFASKLAKIMNDETTQFVGWAVRPPEFKRIVAEFPSSLTDYKYCVERFIMVLMGWAKQRKNVEPVSLIFERGQKIHSEIYEMYEDAVRRYPEFRERFRLASITVIEKYSGETPVVGLQVADYIASGLFQSFYRLTPELTAKAQKIDLIAFLNPKKLLVECDSSDNIKLWITRTMEGREVLRGKRPISNLSPD